MARVFACGEDSHALRLTSELVDLRAENANLVAEAKLPRQNSNLLAPLPKKNGHPLG